MTAPCKTCQRDNDNATHTALEAFGHLNHEYVPDRPEVVVLCGSTRFFDEFRRQNLRLTIEGKIVLSIGCDTKSDDDLFGANDPNTLAALKARLDELHKRKVDLADRVLVLNVGGYIGESTRSEIEYAKAAGKPIDYLEPGCGVSACNCPCPTCEPVQPSVGWGAKTDGEFLGWLAERLVNVYGESPNVDFVGRLRRVADALSAGDS